ncbi:uncharacterized protein LOC144439089 [Glandiceps talaboti]
MMTNSFKLVMNCWIAIIVVGISQAAAQQQNEDVQTDVSQRCGNGIPGIPGIPGTAGSPGTVGAKGESGLPGLDGLHGEKGDKGELGSEGQPGQKGTTGKPGPKGKKGEEGQNGTDGVQGLMGNKGDTGTAGTQGIQGPKGDKGETGQREQQTRVAFSVSKTTSLGPVSSHIVIVYNKVYSNDGNGYDASTGKFTCPVSGMYYFMISAMRRGSNGIYVCLMKNNTKLPCIWISANSGWANGASSNSVIIDIQQGDEIWARLGDGYALYSDHDEYTTFAGYLLYSNAE